MKKLNNKIPNIFSIRAIASLICMSLMTSCVTPTYPINTRQHTSYHSQTNTVSDPTVPLLIGAAAVGTIAYYGKKKYDDHQKPRIKHKPIIRTKPFPPKPIKRQYAHRTKPAHNLNRHVVKVKSAKPHYRATSNNNRVASNIRQDRNVSNQRNSTRNTQNTRRQIIERTREQLQQRRSGDQNVTVNTASTSSETNRNRNNKANRKNQQ